MSTNISNLKVKKVSQLLDLPIDIQPKDALLMVATLTDNYKISINHLLSGVNTTISNNAKIALQNLIDYSNNVKINSNSDILEIKDNSTINSHGVKYHNYTLNIKESVISNYGEIENKDGVVTGFELEKLRNHLSLKDSELENEINDIKDKINDINSESIYDEINTINNKIENIETNVSNNTDNIENLDNAVRNIKSNINVINSNISDNRSHIKKIDDKIEVIEQNESYLMNSIESLNNKIDNIDLNSYVTTISSENEHLLINYNSNEDKKETSYSISLKMSTETEDGIITKNEVVEMIKNINTDLTWEIK